MKETSSKKTSLRWALKEATARNQPSRVWMVATMEPGMIGLMEPLETPSKSGPRTAGHLAGFTTLLKRSLVSSESGRER